MFEQTPNLATTIAARNMELGISGRFFRNFLARGAPAKKNFLVNSLRPPSSDRSGEGSRRAPVTEIISTIPVLMARELLRSWSHRSMRFKVVVSCTGVELARLDQTTAVHGGGKPDCEKAGRHRPRIDHHFHPRKHRRSAHAAVLPGDAESPESKLCRLTQTERSSLPDAVPKLGAQAKADPVTLLVIDHVKD